MSGMFHPYIILLLKTIYIIYNICHMCSSPNLDLIKKSLTCFKNSLKSFAVFKLIWLEKKSKHITSQLFGMNKWLTVGMMKIY